MRRNLISYTLLSSTPVTGFYQTGRRRSCATACRSTPSPPPKARRCTSTAPRRSPRAIARSTRRSPAIPHAIHYALKANSTLAIARLLRGARQQRRRELRRRDRRRAAAPGSCRRRSSSPASARRTAELAQAIDLGVRSDQRRVGRGDRAHRRAVARAQGADEDRHPRQPRHRREEPSAHLDRAEDQQVRHRRSTRCAALCARARGSAGRRDRRPARARRLADHEPRAADAARRRRSSTLARELRDRRARASSTSTRRRARRLVRRLAGARRARDYADAVLPVLSASRAWRSSSSRAGTSSRRPARC